MFDTALVGLPLPPEQLCPYRTHGIVLLPSLSWHHLHLHLRLRLQFRLRLQPRRHCLIVILQAWGLPFRRLFAESVRADGMREPPPRASFRQRRFSSTILRLPT
jgi:hypothetical protein